MATHHRFADIAFLLESRRAEVAALIRPFLQEHLDRVAGPALAG